MLKCASVVLLLALAGCAKQVTVTPPASTTPFCSTQTGATPPPCCVAGTNPCVGTAGGQDGGRGKVLPGTGQ